MHLNELYIFINLQKYKIKNNFHIDQFNFARWLIAEHLQFLFTFYFDKGWVPIGKVWSNII